MHIGIVWKAICVSMVIRFGYSVLKGVFRLEPPVVLFVNRMTHYQLFCPIS
jgi:hypothetical protein